MAQTIDNGNIRITVTGVNATIKRLHKTSISIGQRFPRSVTLKLGRKLAARVRKRIDGPYSSNRSQGAHTGHNTPVSLRRNFRVTRVSKDATAVGFDPAAQRLAEIVERGTKPHPQPNNPIIRRKPGMMHPGAKGKYMWRDGFAEFMATDYDKIVFGEWQKTIKAQGGPTEAGLNILRGT